MGANARLAGAAAVCAFVIIALHAKAHAGVWFYRWHCTGTCTQPWGVSPPHATYATCDAARRADGMNREVMLPGNFGYVTFCEETEDYESVAAAGEPDRRPTKLARLAIGVMTGDGWTHRTPNSETPWGRTTALDFDAQFGRPSFGPIIGAALGSVSQGSNPAPAFSYLETRIGFGVGMKMFRMSAIAMRVRIDLQGGFAFLTSCPCNMDGGGTVGFGVRMGVGVDLFFGAKKNAGVGFDVLAMREAAGNLDDVTGGSEVVSPPLMFRLSLAGVDPGAW